MTLAEGRTDRIRALASREPVSDPHIVGTALLLHQLCRVAARILPATGAAVSLMTEGGPTGIVAAFDEASEVVEELQFVLGEGPCWEAFESRAPVLVPELLGDVTRRWPGYSSAIGAHGVRAAFAFPLQVGAARLGVLDVYRDVPGALSPDALTDALAVATLVTEALLDGQEQAGEGAAPAGVDPVMGSRFAVYQAQGMVKVQLGMPLAEAMSRLRAHAYSQGMTLGEVARDIVARRLILEVDGG